jgi:hypothetical protein
MKTIAWLVLTFGLVLTAPPAAAGDGNDAEFTTEFRLEDCSFSDRGSNPFFSLEPGDRLMLEGDDEGQQLRLKITVLNSRKLISFRTPEGKRLRVWTRVVEEREWLDEELIEVSRNFFARCRETDDIFYFGEDVDIFENGMVSHEGQWRAGLDGAQPGLIMPGRFLLGSRYYQEIAPGVALDRAEHVDMGLTVRVPAGTFEDCVEIEETNALHPEAPGDSKLYCHGIGLVMDADAELVDFDGLNNEDDDSD